LHNTDHAAIQFDRSCLTTGRSLFEQASNDPIQRARC